jgi:hypothetical protein
MSMVSKKRKPPELSQATKKTVLCYPQKKIVSKNRSILLQFPANEKSPDKRITFDLCPTVYTFMDDNSYKVQMCPPKPLSLKDFFFTNKRNPGVLELSENNKLSDAFIKQKIETSRTTPNITYQSATEYLQMFLRSKLKPLYLGRRGTSIGTRLIESDARGILERLIVRLENVVYDENKEKYESNAMYDLTF